MVAFDIKVTAVAPTVVTVIELVVDWQANGSIAAPSSGKSYTITSTTSTPENIFPTLDNLKVLVFVVDSTIPSTLHWYDLPLPPDIVNKGSSPSQIVLVELSELTPLLFINRTPPGPSLTLIVTSFVVIEQVFPFKFDISNLLY